MLLEKSATQTQFEFTQQHQVIRDMSKYGQLVKVSFKQDETRIIAASNPFPISSNQSRKGKPYVENTNLLDDEENEL